MPRKLKEPVPTTIDRFMKRDEVIYVTGLSATEIDRRIEQGRFPKSGKAGPHPTSRKVWRESWIKRWMECVERGDPWTPANDLPPTNDDEPEGT